MPSAFLFGRKRSRKSFGGLEFDVVSIESLTMDSRATDNPVEDGGTVSDHVINLPKLLRMEGVFSGRLGGRQEAYNELEKLRDARQPITVVTGLDVYRNMVIASINISRGAGTGDNLPLTIDFHQITIVSGRVVAIGPIPEVEDVSATQTNAGRQSTTAANDDIQDRVNKSVLKTLWDKIL